MHAERLTLATLGGGAVQERIDKALEKVARNILDPNADPDKKRTITLKITIKPDGEETGDVEVSADVSVSLAPPLSVKTRMFIEEDGNDHLSIMEHRYGEIRGQMHFDDYGNIIGEDVEEDAEAEEGSGMNVKTLPYLPEKKEKRA